MRKAHRMEVDPRSTRIAQHLMADAMDQVAHKRIRHGLGHYQARDEVLRNNAADWVEHAGKETADMAVRGLHYLSADEYLTRHERTLLKARAKADAQRNFAQATGKPVSLVNRISFALFGMALWCVLAAVGGVLVAPTPSYAGEPSPRWKALAACGVAKMDSPDYERRCRAFSRTERSTFRDYDGPGPGAPREWELPRSWE